jgi:tetratricopeptide (TPR) repeat protein
VGCSRQSGIPEPGSEAYRELVKAFYTGLAGLQSGADVQAHTELTRATQIAPAEPAGWANLGILAIRQQELELAYQYMEKARRLAPEDSRIESLLGDIEARRGDLTAAIRHLKRAVELDGRNLKALYSLAEQTERQRERQSDAEALKLLRRLLELQPNNVAVLLDVIRLAARLGDTDTMRQAVASLQSRSVEWPPEVQARYKLLAQSVAGADSRNAAIHVSFLRNLLLRVAAYRKEADAVRSPAVFVGEPFVRFFKLPSPSSEPSEADLETAFEIQAVPHLAAENVQWVRTAHLDDSGNAWVLWADSKEVHLAGGATLPGGAVGSGPQAVALADLNYDFKVDVVVATQHGVRLYHQESPSKFTDVTAQAPLAAGVAGGSYTGAWPFDVELDGDLDVVLGASGAGPIVLRNNGDSTFAITQPFAGIRELASFASADVDGDGDPDVATVDRAGKVTVFMNDRLGQFQSRALPEAVASRVLAIASGDVNGDGSPDFVVLTNDGRVMRLSDQEDGRGWTTSELVKSSAGAPGAQLALADFDNNGSLDLLVGAGEVYLSTGSSYTRVGAAKFTYPDVMDVNGDGRLDLIGVSGKPVSGINRGSKNYKWQIVRTRAATVSGDQRINSFGLGGEIEVRAGLLTQKQIITSPVLHFGLGNAQEASLLRIVWPNGWIQAEFEQELNTAVLAAQRLKGSCPSLFAWDGKRMSFVKDSAPWSSVLGLHNSDPAAASVLQTEEWYKIAGHQLVPRDGYYDIRITAELWETYYIDHYALMVVDHPEGTEVYSDERFGLLPPLKIYTTARSHAFEKALEDGGQDVTGIVRDLDRNYLDTFGRGQYRGITRDHWVELELPDDAPQDGALYLIADGWMVPVDATVSVALGQSSHPGPEGLRIEVPDARGRWTVAKSGLSFPAGKLKTVVLDIAGIFKPGAPRKLRLGSNLEIYWDRLTWAAGVSGEDVRTRRLRASSAELRRRGFSVMRAANASSPEIPDYDQLDGTAQKWRDLEGYYTRYGDVRELLERVDDRFVIVNAGDEIRFRFTAPPLPPPGWVRDFITIGEGWIKDGDYNSAYSKTVLPLPYHGMKDYSSPLGTLENDPAYGKHPGDWQKFHTRYVTPDAYRRALRN